MGVGVLPAPRSFKVETALAHLFGKAKKHKEKFTKFLLNFNCAANVEDEIFSEFFSVFLF